MVKFNIIRVYSRISKEKKPTEYTDRKVVKDKHE